MFDIRVTRQLEHDRRAFKVGDRVRVKFLLCDVSNKPTITKDLESYGFVNSVTESMYYRQAEVHSLCVGAVVNVTRCDKHGVYVNVDIEALGWPSFMFELVKE